ncbi:asparagine synthase [Streptomyces sp. A244]|uniref:asparagine synthase-related protein n=1 Tax=Streptomyces sp. A244 TaxID=2137016 RepID=UPI000D1C1F1F|nr:asparagine synthase-related protein [Streptomyces sp. A244]PTH90235.1 asparagine synthase [Streptomyces sp. A244]
MGFVVLEDNEDGAALADRALGPFGSRIIRYDSGRPWMVGDWAEDELTLVDAGPRRIALVGHSHMDPAHARRVLARASSLHDLDQLVRTLPGSFHFLATLDGRVRAQGSLSTARQIAYARIGARVVACDSPRPLAELADARLDEDTLALRMLTPAAPWPLRNRSMWRGVEQLPLDSWLEIGPQGSRPKRWWEPPAADKPLAEAARAVREALSDSVAVRVRATGTISADLSGGMDSTSLCFLAAGAGGNLLTHHWQPLDSGNDDSFWAERAAGYLPDARHLSTPRGSPWFLAATGLEESALGRAEGPLTWFRTHTHMASLARKVAAEGSRVHLIGVGGDELFSTLPTQLWTLFHRRPVTSLPLLHRIRVGNRWHLSSMVRGLTDRSTFAQWLASAARSVDSPPSRSSEVPLGWNAGVRMPPWATREAVDLVRRLLHEAASADPQPLDPLRDRHQLLEAVALSGCSLRELNSLPSGHGVGWEAPFLDDRVLEAALSLRIEDRVLRGRYKPLLAAAMRGVVPPDVLERRSKGEFSAEVYDGLRQNRSGLLDLCEGSHLARRGLVDPAALRARLLTPGPLARQLGVFEPTLAVEAWLRALGTHHDQHPLPAGEPQ